MPRKATRWLAKRPAYLRSARDTPNVRTPTAATVRNKTGGCSDALAISQAAVAPRAMAAPRAPEASRTEKTNALISTSMRGKTRFRARFSSRVMNSISSPPFRVGIGRTDRQDSWQINIDAGLCPVIDPKLRILFDVLDGSGCTFNQDDQIGNRL